MSAAKGVSLHPRAAASTLAPDGRGQVLAPVVTVMINTGLGLGQIPLSTPASYPLPLDREARPGSSDDHHEAGGREGLVDPGGPAAMFALVSGELPRPLRKRSGLPALISTAAHGVMFASLLTLVLWSNQVALPTPKETTRLVAMLLAAPPPPPPAAPAAPAPAAPEPAGAVETRATPPPEATPAEPAVRPEIPLTALSDVTMPDLAPPPPQFFGGPALNTGLGSGFGGGTGDGTGSGYGVEGGVGWGTGAGGPGSPVRVGGAIETPALTHRVEPVYPPEAVAARVEGTVVIEATVDESGRVQSARVLHSIGPLDQAAIDAVMQWRYSPLRVGGQPAPFIVTVNVSFSVR